MDLADFTSCVEVEDCVEREGVRAEVLSYGSLTGNRQLEVARDLYFARETGARLRQIRLTLNGGRVTVEAGALSFMRGRIEMDNRVGGVGGLMKKAASKMLGGETAFKPVYIGEGELYLEPRFGHFLLADLKQEEVVVDKGMFYACSGGVDVGVVMQKHLSAGLKGGEGWFQTRLRGSGLLVLESPVPMTEILRVPLRDDVLKVDGSFALLRRGEIDFRVEKATRSLLGTMTSGEGLLQVFSGTGEVWLAPTEPVYARLRQQAGAMETGH